MQGALKYRISLAWLIAWIGVSSVMQLYSSEHSLQNRLLPPTIVHPFGFDAFGRDVLLLTLQCSMTSLLFAAIATGLSLLIALFIGSTVALMPRQFQFPILRIIDGLLAFPSLLFALLLASVLGPGWTTLALALLIGVTPGSVRLVYVRTRELLAEEFIVAARGLGAPPLSIIRRHVLPAAVSVCAVKVPNLFAQALLAEATLTFLGIGAPYGQDTWGSLLAQGKEYLIEAPHVALGSGLALVLMTLSLQLIAHGVAAKRAQV